MTKPRSNWRYLSTVALTMVVCGMSTGCSDGKIKTYAVRGKVVFEDGSPVKVGTIECKSQKFGVQATGTIGLDGSFELTTYKQGDGAAAGKHKAVIVQFIQTENIPNYKPSLVGVVNKIHSSYATSGLTFEVSEKGPNDVVIKVQPQAVGLQESDHEHDGKTGS